MIREHSKCAIKIVERTKCYTEKHPVRGLLRPLLDSLYPGTFGAVYFVPPLAAREPSACGLLRSLFPGVAGVGAAPVALPAMRPITAGLGQGNLGRVKTSHVIWPELVKMFTNTIGADIEHADYLALSTPERNTLKKRDAFVLLGTCRGGVRDDEHLESRSAATIDVDKEALDLFNRLEAADAAKMGVVPFSYLYHTTRSYTPEEPRLRIVVPFDRDVTPEEYRHCVRALAALFGVAEIDPSSVKPAQMMFLPVKNKGVSFYAGEWLGNGYVDPGELLADVLDVPESDAKPVNATGGAVATAVAGNTEKTFFRRVNDAAIGNLAAWVPAIWPDAAPYHDGGFRVSSELLGRELEEDISITPRGIKDFGVHDLGDARDGCRTAIDLVREHADVGDRPRGAIGAAFWLCDQLGVTPESMGWVAKQYPYVSEKGQILARLENVVIGLRNREGDIPHIGYDEALADTVVNDGGARSLADNDYTVWQIELERRGFNPLSRDMMRAAVENVAHENAFDSLKDWANDLQWDGVGRVAPFAHTHLGGPLNAYTQGVSHYLWTALAGRAIEPGCKADYVPVLVGREGTGKTQAVEALAPNPRFFAPIDMTAKQDDLARKTRGVVVAEWAEMRGAKTRDEEAIKDFVTRREENHTPKFKERNVRYLRRFIIIGTTNDMGVLPAYGDARRWFPLGIAGNIDIEAIKRDREQLWAEGVYLFKNFGVLWQDADKTSPTVRDDFREEDPMRLPVISWLESDAASDSPEGALGVKKGDTEFSLSDLISDLEARKFRPVAQRVGLLLKDLSYETFRKRQGHHWLRLWRKKA
jgi:hypothetical protein